jgi:hypothetical protein
MVVRMRRWKENTWSRRDGKRMVVSLRWEDKGLMGEEIKADVLQSVLFSRQ